MIFQTRIMFNLLTIFLLATASFSIQAALIHNDAENYTTDTATNLEWLDVDLTTNCTYESVLANTCNSLDLSSWRYATNAEIESFWTNAGAVGPFNGWSATNNGFVVPFLSNYWGFTVAQYNYAYVLTADPYDDFQQWVAYAYDNPDEQDSATQDYLALYSHHWANSSPHPYVGSALVRATNVPEPAALALLGLGLAGLGFVHRKKAT